MYQKQNIKIHEATNIRIEREIDKFTLKIGDFMIPYAVIDQLAIYY